MGIEVDFPLLCYTRYAASYTATRDGNKSAQFKLSHVFYMTLV